MGILTRPSTDSLSHWSMTMDWLIVEQSLEDELALEQSIRSIYDVTDLKAVQDICASMARQAWMQRTLLKQAVNHIAELDTWAEASL